MLISVIITTKNEEKNIGNCLESILEQTYPLENVEMIVVDNNSTDKTREIALKYTDKVFNFGPERSAQKNFGVQQSNGEYFIHLDADMELSKNVIKECVEKISEDESVLALYIPEIMKGESFFSKVRKFERGFYNGIVVDAVRFISKDEFLAAGGFDEKMYACEDWDLDKRIKKLGQVKIIKAVLYHNEQDSSITEYLRKKAYYSKNVDVYIKKWGKNDPDIRKQFGFYYRFIRVFTENGKWKELLRHPILALAMYFLKLLVGIRFLIRKI